MVWSCVGGQACVSLLRKWPSGSDWHGPVKVDPVLPPPRPGGAVPRGMGGEGSPSGHHRRDAGCGERGRVPGPPGAGVAGVPPSL